MQMSIVQSTVRRQNHGADESSNAVAGVVCKDITPHTWNQEQNSWL